MIYVCIDNETHLISDETTFPKIVCCGAAWLEAGQSLDSIQVEAGTLCEGTVYKIWKHWLTEVAEGRATLVNVNLAFDLGTVFKAFPDLASLIFRALSDGNCVDLKIHEQLMNLAYSGNFRYRILPNGESRVILYDLNSLTRRYLKIDLSEDKEMADAWRTNFAMLDDKPWDEYPEEAQVYVQTDAAYAVGVYLGQLEKIAQRSLVVPTASFETAVDFCLGLWTERGVQLDVDRAKRIASELAKELDEEKMGPLIEAGILRPAKPPRPYANGARDADGNPKVTKGKKASINMKALRKYVEVACDLHGISLEGRRTESGEVKVDKEMRADLAPLDHVMKIYDERQTLYKLVTTYLPKVLPGGVLRFPFNVLVETGRTSSSQSKLFLSTNGQNMDPRVRPCCVARDGLVYVSVDFSANELVSLADTCYKLFGYSVARDMINLGVDLHAFLGAQIAYEKWETFRELCDGEGIEDAKGRYDVFVSLKGCGYRDLEAEYKNYRTLAKPVGLGYPGGLGAKTFLSFAKGYGQNLTIEEAEHLKQIWFATYPEMVDYFRYVNNDLADPYNPGFYAYSSPLGRIRRGATYCAAANGLGLQTPCADGGKLAIFAVTRECYDPSRLSPLYGNTWPVDFVHDEIIVETREDDGLTKRAKHIADLMVAAMEVVVHNVTVRAEPAAMRRWYKQADPYYVDGKLTPWDDQLEEEEGASLL